VNAVRYAIAFGSNLGDRRRHLAQALAMIDRLPGATVLATSALYESAAWGNVDQGEFLNAAAAVESTITDPRAFLRELALIEDRLGRTRHERWGPRTLDLDLLAADDIESHAPELQLPHPWISRRPFVYMPLRELADLHPAWPALCTPHEEGRKVEAGTRRVEEGPSPWSRRVTPARELTIETFDEAGSAALGAALAEVLLPGDAVALDGPLGAGKSVISRAIARGLGITGPVPSPTFTLCREYDTAHKLRFEHWDFYRLGDAGDLESTGFNDARPGPVVRAVEWASLFPGALPPHALRLAIEPTGAESRRITISTSCARLPFPAHAIAASLYRRVPA
jgi:2-amino-4-hydroxy-6-hydroxymethyldihydropteridine diphosphokinase